MKLLEWTNNYENKSMIATIKLIIAGIIIYLSIIMNSLYAQDNNSYLLPPQLIENPALTMYCTENRRYSGVPSLAVSRGGRLWAMWYAGITPGEDENSYVVVATSGDKGETWEEVLVIDPDGPGSARAFDPQPWLDPDGKLWLFWSQARLHRGEGVWAIVADDADNSYPSWSKPRRIFDGVMMNKPVILSSGEWVFPDAKWFTEYGTRMVVSVDKGQSFYIRGGVYVPEDVRNYDEHIIVERKDGTLWMLVRTTYGIGESVSTDRGMTWSQLTPSNIENPTARFFIRRLQSGNLLLVKNGPTDLRSRRSHLMAFVSKDEGYSWSSGFLLDERLGVSYPDGQQAKDGTIYIIYDYDRMGQQKILMTSFREEDVVECSDKKMVEVWQRRREISKGGIE
jgi:predicted neuraminidase